jgi:hypothetical protein
LDGYSFVRSKNTRRFLFNYPDVQRPKYSGGEMKTKSALHITALLVLLSFTILSLVGCGPSTTVPASTPGSTAPVLSIVNLPDGSRIVLKGESEISLSTMAGVFSMIDDQASIVGGEILVVSTLPSGTWFTVMNTRGFIAHVTADSSKPGAIMLVMYDSIGGKFTIDCIQGICELGSDAAHMTGVSVGSEAWLDQGGSFQGPTTFDLNAITAIYGKYIQLGLTAPTLIVTPPTATATVTPTFDLAATATAVCQDFHSKHPSTPCP